MTSRDDIPRIAAKGRAAGELLEAQGEQLLVWSLAYQKGYPTGGDGPSGKGSVSDPTFRSAVERDPFLIQGRSFAQWLRAYHEAACAVVELGVMLAPIDPEREEQARERKSSGGDCGACGRYVPNAEGDRIESGYCHTCYVAWTRTDKGAGRLDRRVFEQTRRQAS